MTYDAWDGREEAPVTEAVENDEDDEGRKAGRGVSCISDAEGIRCADLFDTGQIASKLKALSRSDRMSDVMGPQMSHRYLFRCQRPSKSYKALFSALTQSPDAQARWKG